MKPSQIILQDKSIVARGDSPEKLLLEIQKLVKKNAAILLQKNNSVLLLVNLGDEDAEVRMFTADTPAKLGQSLKYFFEQLKGSGLKRLYGTDEKDSPMIRMLGKDFGVDIQDSDRSNYKWMMER
jgi:hypothetical protein